MDEDTKDFGDIRCTTMTPLQPKRTRILSACFGEVKDFGIYVALSSPAKKLTPDEAKVLFDKATARLP